MIMSSCVHQWRHTIINHGECADWLDGIDLPTRTGGRTKLENVQWIVVTPGVTQIFIGDIWILPCLWKHPVVPPGKRTCISSQSEVGGPEDNQRQGIITCNIGTA